LVEDACGSVFEVYPNPSKEDVAWNRIYLTHGPPQNALLLAKASLLAYKSPESIKPEEEG